ncbi:MAG: hypothetical protein WCK77_07870 [Verrucomicrobiota bacterium]
MSSNRIANTNDGSPDAPKLRFFLNLNNLEGLPPGSLWPGLEGEARFARLAADGFHGIQLPDGQAAPPACQPLATCASDRISTAAEAADTVARYADHGHQCLTVHAGWGIEDDDAVFRLVEAILSASERAALPVYIETHRATITQDIWRTVQLTKRFPEIRFNGDLSHYYTGQELVYGGLDMKIAFMAPIFERIRFMHARIGSPGHIQMPVGDGSIRPLQASGEIDYLADFKQLWTRAMVGFLTTAGPGDFLIVCPELLSRRYYYARTFPDPAGVLHEESDRYAEALTYIRIASECFAAARLA